MISSEPSTVEVLVSILSSPLERAGRFRILVGLVESSVSTQIYMFLHRVHVHSNNDNNKYNKERMTTTTSLPPLVGHRQ